MYFLLRRRRTESLYQVGVFALPPQFIRKMSVFAAPTLVIANTCILNTTAKKETHNVMCDYLLFKQIPHIARHG